MKGHLWSPFPAPSTKRFTPVLSGEHSETQELCDMDNLTNTRVSYFIVVGDTYYSRK